jgi:hypothetical protein
MAGPSISLTAGKKLVAALEISKILGISICHMRFGGPAAAEIQPSK